MKKKELFAGVLIGSVLIGAAAFAVQYTATENPFPVQLNGQNIQLEGYNINDSTYFKLRDIADAVGGFTVDFNNDTIQLSKDGYAYNNTGSSPSASAAVLKSYAPVVKMLYDEEHGKTYDNVRFKLADMSGDGNPELIAASIGSEDIEYFEIFYYDAANSIDTDEVVKIHSRAKGSYAGWGVQPIIIDGVAYLYAGSTSSGTGFLNSLEQYDGNEWQQVQYSRTDYDKESGKVIGYTVNDRSVSEEEYNSFNEKIENAIMSLDDFVPANQL